MSDDKAACDRLTRPPSDFVSFLAAGENYAKIAVHYGVARNTIRRWAGEPEIIADLEEIRADTLEAAKRKINTSIDVAVDTLLNVMDQGDSSSARVAAARVLMDRCLPTLTTAGLTGSVSIAVTDFSKLTDEALTAERDALAAKLAPPKTGA